VVRAMVVDSSEAELRLIRVAGAGGTEAGTTRCRLVSLPLACRFNQEASQVLVVYAEQVVLHRVPDLQIVAPVGREFSGGA